MAERAETVELPDGERVTGPHVVQSGDQARPVCGGPAGAGLLLEDPAAPGEGERVALELGVLDVGADTGQADEVALAAGEIEHGEGRGGGCGLCHIPQCLKTVSGAAGREHGAHRAADRPAAGGGAAHVVDRPPPVAQHRIPVILRRGRRLQVTGGDAEGLIAAMTDDQPHRDRAVGQRPAVPVRGSEHRVRPVAHPEAAIAAAAVQRAADRAQPPHMPGVVRRGAFRAEPPHAAGVGRQRHRASRSPDRAAVRGADGDGHDRFPQRRLLHPHDAHYRCRD